MDDDQNRDGADGSNEHKIGSEVWKGIGLIALLHLLWVFYPPAVFAIGISQMVYLFPALLFFAYRGRVGIVNGLLIGAGITLLLNATCFGIVISRL